MQTLLSSVRSRLFVATLVTIAGCGGGNGTVDSGTDAFVAPTSDGGTDAGHATVADTGVDASSTPAADTGIDAPATTIADTGVDAPTTTVADTGVDAPSTAMGCLFHGRYVATDIRCNGVAYTAASALTWIADDDGTTATFTETVSGCSLIATGTIVCDSPAAGQFTHHPSAALSCSPAACTPFASACSGSAVGATATWSYTRNSDGTITATTSDASIHTCTAGSAPQGNPLSIVWMPQAG